MNRICYDNINGRYQVLLKGITDVNAAVQVTAIGGDTSRCIASGWGLTTDSTGMNVYVRCHDLAGNQVFSAFDLSFMWGTEFGYTIGTHVFFNAGYVSPGLSRGVAQDGFATVSFSTATSGSDLVITSTNTGTTGGWLDVIPLVTMYSASSALQAWCAPIAYGLTGTGLRDSSVTVRCFRTSDGAIVSASAQQFLLTLANKYLPFT